MWTSVKSISSVVLSQRSQKMSPAHINEAGFHLWLIIISYGFTVVSFRNQDEMQQVIYEESVVEVGNPRGEDGDGKKQYAIVLLPSTAASGDEPEAALSMLQLQSGNTITMGESGVEYIVQQAEEQ